MINVYYDDEGSIKGFSSKENKPLSKEYSHIKITEEQKKEYFANNKNYKVIDGIFTYIEPEAPKLEELQTAKWQQIKQSREEQKSKGFLFKNIRFDSDEKAQASINSAALDALHAKLANSDYQVEWTTFHNDVIMFDAEQMLALQSAMARASANIHACAAGLRKLIDAAQNQEELDTITCKYDETVDYTTK